MSGVLEGVKVLEMGHVVAVPAAAAAMADWGADVIKVEPLTGDMARGIGLPITAEEIAKAEKDYGNIGWYFQFLNRGKRGIALNLKSKEGRDAFYKLVKWADIFMTNYEVGTLEKLGADYATLKKINPSVVYAVLTGYGTVGPDKDERGFDYAAAWARSGLMYMMGEPNGTPPPQRGGMMDRVVGAHMTGGVLAAYIHKMKTGKGQKLEFSLYQTGVWTDAEDIQPALLGREPVKHDRTKARNPIWNNYRTKDDRWFWLANLQPDLTWSGFCKAIGRPELEQDPRFNTIATRFEHCEELIKIIDAEMAKKTQKEWEVLFRQHNVIYGRVQSPQEVIADSQALANNFFVPLHHPTATNVKVVMTPVKFVENPAEVKKAAPEIGQDTEEILLSVDYSWEDIAGLKEKGIIL
ncbi:MAG: CoA transferase [Dehalococcoidales bacterium]|nr:CoA transferase [Dehalococcoidales bacterium]